MAKIQKDNKKFKHKSHQSKQQVKSLLLTTWWFFIFSYLFCLPHTKIYVRKKNIKILKSKTYYERIATSLR